MAVALAFCRGEERGKHQPRSFSRDRAQGVAFWRQTVRQCFRWPTLAAYPCREVRRVTIPLHGDLGEGAVDLAEIVGGQFDRRRAEVLFEPMQLRGSGDRNDPRLLRQQPSERDLSRGRLLSRRDFAKQIDESLVRFPGLWREARDDVAEIALIERRFFADRAREEAFA